MNFKPLLAALTAALLFAGSAQAQETADHRYMMKYAADFGTSNAADWRAEGLDPNSPEIVQELAQIMIGWGRTDKTEIWEFIRTAQAAAIKADATMDAVLGQQ